MLDTVSIGTTSVTLVDRWERMVSGVDNIKQAGREDDEAKCVRFVTSPEGFLFDVPVQEHVPHEENVGNHSLAITGSARARSLG